MNSSYLRILLGLQMLVLPAYVFVLPTVERIQALPVAELRSSPHNLYYLQSWFSVLVRISGFSYGLALATLILVVVMRKDVVKSKFQLMIAVIVIIIIPATISILGRHQQL